MLPVARVCIDSPLPHLDRAFDYLVPTEMDPLVVAGSQVRVRFSGRLIDGFVLERAATSEHVGRLAFITRAFSSQPVVSAEIAELARELADRYAGTLSDVLRLAIPPRHAAAGKSVQKVVAAQKDQEGAGSGAVSLAVDSPSERFGGPAQSTSDHPLAGWSTYQAGAAFVRAVSECKPARAVWNALPREDWPRRMAELALAAMTAGRGVVLVVPDARDVALLDAAVSSVLGADKHVVLTAALGPQERYRRWLLVRHGVVRCVIGTRAAAFAPVVELGLVGIWDDGDNSHAEPRAPYCHAREILLTRAQQTEAAVLVGGFGHTAEAQLLVESGWARPLTASREVVRQRAPRVTALDEDSQLARDAAAASARLPSVAWQVAREALAVDTPVLIQVPRRGYVPSLLCQQCRTSARCGACAGPLMIADRHTVPSCRWCGRPHAHWHCESCGSRNVKAAVVGARRTAEELGRAFPHVPVVTSGRESIVDRVGAGAALVVSTPGAEPAAAGGYGAALLLDTWALLTRADLRAGEEALRRWLNAAALVRSAQEGGRVVITADGGLSVVQAFVRWDPSWHASRELAERGEVGFPPASRMAKLVGSAGALAELTKSAHLPSSAELLGPVPCEAWAMPAAWASTQEGAVQEQLLIRVPRRDGRELAVALRAAVAVRSARKGEEIVRVQIDPHQLT